METPRNDWYKYSWKIFCFSFFRNIQNKCILNQDPLNFFINFKCWFKKRLIIFVPPFLLRWQVFHLLVMTGSCADKPIKTDLSLDYQLNKSAKLYT